MAATATYEIDERRYLKEKVVATYEKLWRGDDIGAHGFAELFRLKVNAAWLQSAVANLPAAEVGRMRPVVRRLFAECCARLSAEHAADEQSHAMETLAGVFLGVGSRTFHDPVSDVLELLCGLQQADEAFATLLGRVHAIASSKSRGATQRATRRAALRLLLSLTAAASDLHSNILVDLLMPRKFEGPIGAILASEEYTTPPPAPQVEGAAPVTVPSEREDACLLAVLLAAYRRHESPNAFLRLIGEAAPKAELLRTLEQSARRTFLRCMYPAAEGVASSYVGSSWAPSLVRAVEWTAHMLTLEAYLPASVTSNLSGGESLQRNASALSAALLISWELTVPKGGAILAAITNATEAAAAAGGAAAGGGAAGAGAGAAGGSGGSARGALLRHLFSLMSLLGCDARSELQVAQLRLAMLTLERVLDGAASAPLLLQVDLGGALPHWRLVSGRPAEAALPSPQPLLAAAYVVLSDVLTQNLRRATFKPELYAQALTLLHRLLLAQLRANQTLPVLKWPSLWDALFTVATFIADEETFSVRGVPEVGLQLLTLINLLIALGDQIFPSPSTFEAFAYELVRRHRTFEQLYKVGRRLAPRLVQSLTLARSMIVGALDALANMDERTSSSLTPHQAIEIIRNLHLKVGPDSTALLRPPAAQLSPHEQMLLSQTLLRVLLDHARRDGSLAPLHFEDLAG